MQIESAIGYFKAVNSSPYLTSALAEWASYGSLEDKGELLAALTQARENNPDDAALLWRLTANYYQIRKQNDLAWQVFEQSLIAFPDNITLLYDQAMLASSLNQPDTTEANLSLILKLDPTNVNALNALGYTWVDLNKNLESAGDYIERALNQEPNNPAFLDSKGWYLYRIGQLNEALILLEKAFDSMQNDEVAAHIAEVLWYLDREDDARDYLAKAIELNPSSQYVNKLDKLFND